MAISIQKRVMLFALAAMLGATVANLSAQQDNSREIKPVDLSVHADVESPARESQQSLELSPESATSRGLPAQKKDVQAGICPESTSNISEENSSRAEGGTKTTSNLSQWTVSPETRPSGQKFGRERAKIMPAEDCLPNPDSRKPIDQYARSGRSTLPPAGHKSSTAVHTRVLAPPEGLESSIGSPLSSPFKSQQLAPSTNFSVNTVKLPKAQSHKKKPVADDSSSRTTQDSFEPETSTNTRDNKQD